MEVLIILAAACLGLALKGRFAAWPFRTMIACSMGVLISSFYVGYMLPFWSSISWIDQWIIVGLAGIMLPGFMWMFFRSLIDLREIKKKLTKIIDDERKKNDALLGELEKYQLRRLDQDQDE